MITKKHLTKYLEELSFHAPSQEGELSSEAWQRYIQYLIDHYKRLDKEARSYADDIFDQVEAAIERTIGSLSQGAKKDLLRRKLAVVRGERSPLPVLYLDTPVLENMIRYALGEKLLKAEATKTRALYETIGIFVRGGKLVYPENSFHRETLQMGGPPALKALGIIRTLSGRMSFQHGQSIEDFQIFRALRGFIDNNNQVNYRAFWKDAFQKETVLTILKKRPFITFEGLLALPDRSSHGTSQKGRGESFTARLRIRHGKTALKSDLDLQKRSSRHLRDLVRLGMRYRSLLDRGPKNILDGFWESQKSNMALALWNHLGGKPDGTEGLASFYVSEHFRDVPTITIKKQVWNAHEQHNEDDRRRVPPPADMSVLASVFPYADIMILERRMADVVRDRLKLDAKYDVKVLASDEHEQITKTFEEIDRLH
jgi:hypothetical protein